MIIEETTVEQQADEQQPATPEGAAPAAEGQETPTDTRPTWEQRLDALLEDDGDDGDDDQEQQAGEQGADGQAAAPKPAQPQAEGAGEGEEEEQTPAPVKLTLPGRRAEDQDLEIELTPEQLEAAGIDAQQFTERMAQLRNGFMRGEQVRAERAKNAEDAAELEFIENELRERPVEFVRERVDPKLYPALAKDLLLRLSDEEFDALLDTVAAWERDPSKRRDERATAREQEVDSRERRDFDRRRTQQRTAYQQEISGALVAMIPETMDEAQADEFFDFALHKLERWARQQPRGTRLTGDQIPALLDELGALAPFGLSREASSTPAARPANPSGTRRTRPVDPEAEARAKRTGQDLRARATRRKDAAAVTPAGSGSAPAAAAAPPRGQTFEERMDWLEKKLGLK